MLYIYNNIIYQNNNCHKVSTSEPIISKSYKEAGRSGRNKLLIPRRRKGRSKLLLLPPYERFTLVKGLFKPCY